MEHPNAVLLRRYVSAMQSGDTQAVLRFYTDDLVMHVPGRSAHAGTYRGREAVLEYYTRIGRDTDGGFVVTGVHDILASDDHVAMLVGWRLSRGGRTIEIDRVVLYRLVDGRIAEIWVRDWDQYAYDELFAAG
jgi:uncharacterized protein